jgi:hypothetical protein
MKLSEAIRKGATLHPQVFGCFVGWAQEEEDGTPIMGTCAIGAAYEAITGNLPTNPFDDTTIEALLLDEIDEMNDEFGDERVIGYPSQLGLTRHEEVTSVIACLNDFYAWKREDIADYLQEEGL